MTLGSLERREEGREEERRNMSYECKLAELKGESRVEERKPSTYASARRHGW